MSNYFNGATFERKVAAKLTHDGYAVVRAAGSKGACDLVCLKPGQVVLVQVKRTNPQLPPAERSALWQLAQFCGGLPIVAFQPEPRKPIRYRLLTGYGPKQWTDWSPDFAEDVA